MAVMTSSSVTSSAVPAKAGVAAVHEDGAIALGVAAQGVDQLPPFVSLRGRKSMDSSPSREQGHLSRLTDRTQPRDWQSHSYRLGPASSASSR